ncbi:argonaute-like protein [Mycena rebaudengoi]|nr:argonaute-like protein [Mycena rebaudengoi]
MLHILQIVILPHWVDVAEVTSKVVKRVEFGTAGMNITLIANSFRTDVKTQLVHQYDDILPPEHFPPAKMLPIELSMRLIHRLQFSVAPQIFNGRAVYDGHKKMFSANPLRLEENGSVFFVPPPESQDLHDDHQLFFRVSLKFAHAINTEVLRHFVTQKQSNDKTFDIALQAMNVVVRMEPLLSYPTGKARRYFYSGQGADRLGSGIILWHGYFQSLRPSINRLIINIDTSTCMMYSDGPLIRLCKEFLGVESDRDFKAILRNDKASKLRLVQFITGIRVSWSTLVARHQVEKTRGVKGLSVDGADKTQFTKRDGTSSTVASYFLSVTGRALRHPDLPCVEVGKNHTAYIPLEMCNVIPGQALHSEFPAKLAEKRVGLSTVPPAQRLENINKGIQVLRLGPGQSEYVEQFGIRVDPNILSTAARVLQPPVLKYKAQPGGAETTVTPRNGNWNMLQKHFYAPAAITRWVLMIHRHVEIPERDSRSGQGRRQIVWDDVIRRFVGACRATGITVVDDKPVMTRRFEDPTAILKDLDAVNDECKEKYGTPTMFLIILPDHDGDLYIRVKHWGDILRGIPTQCLKPGTCSPETKDQTWWNIAHKVNVKLGGINLILDPANSRVSSLLGDATMIMGADVAHDHEGSATQGNQPSCAAVVGSLDSHAVKYAAISTIQGRQELIDTDELCKMIMHLITRYIHYRREREHVPESRQPPKRIILYRDGVPDGQFEQILGRELPSIRKACSALNIEAKITIILVGKRHHMRSVLDSSSGAKKKIINCQAGTIIDRDVVHPLDFDFFLQSHGGSRGTSRPAHYSVVFDENNFGADDLQALSFALCHVYARSTRAVSIPAPVYYADQVCTRARNHYDRTNLTAPGMLPTESPAADTSTQRPADTKGALLKSYKQQYLSVHENQQDLMYFV